MKLNIFLVLLTVFLLSCLGSNIQEGFGIVQDMGNLGGDVGRTVGNVVGGVAQGVGDVAGGVVQGVGDVAGGVARGVGDVIGGVGQGIDDALGIGYDNRYPYPPNRYPYPYPPNRYPYPPNRYPYPPNRYPIVEYEERPQRDPREDDDEWIRKSQIVPPVCPKCPDIRTCQQTPCPPCPPCARCPDPAFTCEKVPNYKSRSWMANGPNGLPRPVLGDFSTFGM